MSDEHGDTNSKKNKTTRRGLCTLIVILATALFLGAAWLVRYAIWVNIENVAIDSIEHGKMSRALEAAQKGIGLMSWFPDNKSFALSLRLLSDIYACRRRFKQAEIYNSTLLSFDKKIWGVKSAEYAGDLSDLALMKRKERQFAESERLYKLVVATYQLIPSRKVEAARNKALLAWIIFQQGDSKEALELIAQSDSVLRQQFGEASFERLVGLVERLRISAGTTEAYTQADLTAVYKLITEPKKLEKSSAQTVVVLSLFAQILDQEGDTDKALTVFAIAEANCKSSVFGSGYNLFMADILDAHANLLLRLGQKKEADGLKLRVREIREPRAELASTAD